MISEVKFLVVTQTIVEISFISIQDKSERPVIVQPGQSPYMIKKKAPVVQYIGNSDTKFLAGAVHHGEA
jgi:hypothetical protein